MTREAYTLHPAGPDDLADLADLEARCFEHDRTPPRQLRYLLSRPTAEIRLMRDPAGGIAGSLVLLFRRDSNAARLYSIAVRPDCRGRGLSRRLLDEAEKRSAARGCRELRLEVSETNVPAIRLYTSCGFETFGRRAAYYEDGSDAVRMRKLLLDS